MLTFLNGKQVFYSLRCLLRFCLEDPDASAILLNFSLASHLYRIFVILLRNDFSRASLEQVFNPYQGLSDNNLLKLFEVTLFNRKTHREAKSSALMSQRERLFEYFEYKEAEIVCSMDRVGGEESQRAKIRLFYAMMYYAFEIKNDMHASISYF